MAKEYQDYTFEDFIADDDFIVWVKHPSDASNAFWENHISDNPHQTMLIGQAKEGVLQLKIASRKNAPESDSPLIWDKLASTKLVDEVISSKFRFRWKPWLAAASVLVLLGAMLSLSLWYNGGVPQSSYSQQVSSKNGALKEIINASDAELNVVLPDSSKITLKPNSKISYDPLFAGNSREIFLSGEAFFDVQKNPRKPFVVYANGLVTKALGTSFSVEAFEDDEKIIVKVQTGKVAVYSTKSSKNEDPETGGLVLFANQKVEFETVEERFIRTLVEKPLVLESRLERNQFAFNNAPVATILEDLEKAYGVEIIYDKDVLSNCHLTTTLTDGSLFEKLDIICAAMEANYKEIDARIIISSKGCK